MILKDLIDMEIKNLRKNNIEDIYFKINILILYVFNIPKEKVLINENRIISNEEFLKFRKCIKDIINGVPIQYIIHKQEFMGLEFYVDENVLIPQPDTEILVEEVVKHCKENSNNIKILDLCTGSGIIAISIAKYLQSEKVCCEDKLNIEIYATDISEEAINIAQRNARQNNVQVKFIKSDMFKKIKEKQFDIIVSNPPYIETNTINMLSKEVQNEPKKALDGGKDGLDFYRIIAENAKDYLNEGAIVFLEIGYNQKESVTKIFNDEYNKIECVKDLCNNDRVMIIYK